jgi:hypothetical protein
LKLSSSSGDRQRGDKQNRMGGDIGRTEIDILMNRKEIAGQLGGSG